MSTFQGGTAYDTYTLAPAGVGIPAKITDYFSGAVLTPDEPVKTTKNGAYRTFTISAGDVHVVWVEFPGVEPQLQVSVEQQASAGLSGRLTGSAPSKEELPGVASLGDAYVTEDDLNLYVWMPGGFVLVGSMRGAPGPVGTLNLEELPGKPGLFVETNDATASTDTEWRNITPPSAVEGMVLIRRQGGAVWLDIDGLIMPNPTSSFVLLDELVPPSCITRGPSYSYYPAAGPGTSATAAGGIRINPYNGDLVFYQARAGSGAQSLQMFASIHWPTDAAPPTPPYFGTPI